MVDLRNQVNCVFSSLVTIFLIYFPPQSCKFWCIHLSCCFSVESLNNWALCCSRKYAWTGKEEEDTLKFYSPSSLVHRFQGTTVTTTVVFLTCQYMISIFGYIFTIWISNTYSYILGSFIDHYFSSTLYSCTSGKDIEFLCISILFSSLSLKIYMGCVNRTISCFWFLQKQWMKQKRNLRPCTDSFW